ncbi:MAG: FHA domain-containing protein, partial [Streptomyces sp.]|uniref:FHA domain-containing protein n=1 Tax=Streptomyces sp. TaxID=1931 RepID=UPI003D6BEAA4
MQIRLTVTFGSRGSGRGAGEAAGARAACDVVVTAPFGTPLSAVTGALASAGGGAGAGGGAESTADSTAVYAGTERLDPHRQVLGEPPLLDGAVVSLHGPALPATTAGLAAYGSAKARLHVIAGPDAGGIHLLQGGKVQLGRSADTDVPLDDPDVSRLHCAVTVTDGGAVTVTDLGSTNGTSLDGAPVGRRPVLFQPGSTLRIGESEIRLETAPPDGGLAAGGAAGGAEAVEAAHPAPGAAAPVPALPASLATLPDGKGRLRLLDPREGLAGEASRVPGLEGTGQLPGREGSGAVPSQPGRPGSAPASGPAGGHPYAGGGPFPGDGSTHGAGIAQHARYPVRFGQHAAEGPGEPEAERPRARGLGAWARRFAGGARP